MALHPTFRAVIRDLDTKLQRLLACDLVQPNDLPLNSRSAGVYLFTERGHHLYVGRSNHLRRRMGRHGAPGSTHRHAAFAFRLAREATGIKKASYSTEGSRASLMQNPAFRMAFEKAKERIRKMQLRFVLEPDPQRQALLEIYVSIALATPYNDFDNH